MEAAAPESHILLQSPVRLLDSWHGVTDPKMRKKLQNRLNQRAHRRRQRALREQSKQQVADGDIKQESVNECDQRLSKISPSSSLSYSPSSTASSSSSSSSSSPRSLDHVPFCNSATIKHLEEFEALIRMEFATGSPTADLLLGLTQLNIIRALFANQDILGYTVEDMHDDALSVFNLNLGIDSHHVCKSSIVSTQSNLPLALRPTKTQFKLPHHPWLDLLPFPKMRDNLIRAGDSFDDLKLCHDMCGYRVPETGILIWKEPWDPSGWEVTERFLQLWGWAVRDCWELYESTDRWRRKRGEKPLFNLPRTSS